MAPKRAVGGTGVGRPVQQQGYMRQITTAISDPENRSLVTSVAFFAAGIAFLHSSWSEVLIPPI